MQRYSEVKQDGGRKQGGRYSVNRPVRHLADMKAVNKADCCTYARVLRGTIFRYENTVKFGYCTILFSGPPFRFCFKPKRASWSNKCGKVL